MNIIAMIYILFVESYLIKFLDLILGILMAEPTRELPVMKIPL